MTPPECNCVFVIKSTTSIVFAWARLYLFSYFFAKALGGGLGGQDGAKMVQDGAKMSQDGAKMSQDGAKMEEEGRRKKGTEGSKHQEERREQNKEDLYTLTPDQPALCGPILCIYI